MADHTQEQSIAHNTHDEQLHAHDVDANSDLAKGTIAQTDMGWPDIGTWTYRLLQEPYLSKELERQANAHTYNSPEGATSVTIQPCPNPEQRSQDRFLVANWSLPGGVWSFAAVFDGHAGHDTVDYTLEFLPDAIKSALETLLSVSPSPSAESVSTLLAKCIESFDDSITAALFSLFPGGEESIREMSNDQIKAIINDGGKSGANAAILSHCMRGTTALVALVDPQKANIWVASLGDCVAVLGTINESQGQAEGIVLSVDHNGRDPSEVARILSEHPGEEEAIMRDRVLGAIAVTRAIGDHEFKVPAIYTERVFTNAAAGFLTHTPVSEILPRIKTPPYVSGTPDVRHVLLGDTFPKSTEPGKGVTFLILCSDGLTDLFDQTVEPNRWAHIVGSALMTSKSVSPKNAAAALLRTAFGGDDAVLVSRLLTVEMTNRWMDDTTVVVLPL